MRLNRFLLATGSVLFVFFFFNISKLEAQDANDFYLKGEKFFKARQLKSARFDSAITYYNKAINLNPGFTQAYLSRGFSYAELNQVDRAIEDFTTLISLAPDSSDYFSYRGELYFKQARFTDAIKDYSSAIKLMRPDDKEGAVINYGGRYKAWYFVNEIDSALNDIDALIRLQPNFPGNYNNRALCFNNLGQYEDAIEDYIRYLAKEKNQGNAYVNIISPLARMKRFDDAVYYAEEFKRKKLVSFLDDSKYEFYRYFINAVTLVAKGFFQDALNSLDTAFLKYGTEIKSETRRGYIDILWLKGYVQEQLGQNDVAMTEYEQSLAIDLRQPDVVSALQNLQYKTFTTRSNNDNSPPLLKRERFETDTIPLSTTDSIRIRIKGTAFDSSGVQFISINKTNIPFSSEGKYLAFFEYDLIKKITDSTDIVVTVVDSANLERNYRKSINETRGTIVTVESESPCTGMGKYHAILIAEEDYQAGWKKLKNPVRDANRLRNILINQYSFDSENVDTLYNRSRSDILETIINRCKQLGPDDNLLIFYAGHGDTTHDRLGNLEGYLVPVEAPLNKDWYYINAANIKSALLRSNARHILIMLDACYSGSFTRGDKEPEKNAADLCNQYLLPSRKVMASGSSNQQVPDNSFFINIIANSLQNSTGNLSTQDLWIDVYKKMPKTGFDGMVTTPQYSDIKDVGDDGGSFIFKLRKKN
jgi:tetratricopeptide (TPR) repeat protein